MSNQTLPSYDADKLEAVQLVLMLLLNRIDGIPGGLKAANLAKADAMAMAETMATAQPGSQIVQAVRSLTSGIQPL